MNSTQLSTGRIAVLAGIVFAFSCRSGFADERTDFFENKIRFVLADRCWSCHSEQLSRNNGSLHLDSLAALELGGDSGPAFDRQDVTASLLLRAIRQTDSDVSAMPPTGNPLTKSQIADFEKWIIDGAVFPKVVVIDDGRSHWAFEPVRTTPIPSPLDDQWCNSDIDRYLRIKMEQNT